MILLEYKDISLTAKNDSTVSCADKQSFSNLELLKQDEVEYKKFATLEQDFFKLDGSFKNFPDNPSEENFALWSESMSDLEGNFNSPIEINIDFNAFESCVGIALSFSTLTGDYPTKINVKWYQNDTLLSDKNFESDSTEYFCENSVESFNKIIITCLSTNKPYRYLKLQDIVYGVIRNFREDELRKLTLLEEVSLTSEEMMINTLELTLNNKQAINFIFQKKQPLTLYRNDTLLGTFFIDTSKQKSATLYEISAVDYIGVLDVIPFDGGTYSNETVANLVKSILGNIPYSLDENIGNKTLSGVLEACTCREALLQVAFASCAMVDTSRSNQINIFPSDLTIKSNIEDGIYTGVNFETSDAITEVRLKLNDGTMVTKRNPILLSDALDNVLEFSGVFIDSHNAEEVLNLLYDYYVTNGNNLTNMKFMVTDEKVSDVITYTTEYLGTKKGRITQMKFSLNSTKLVAQAKLKGMV